MKINAAIIILVGRPNLFRKTLKSFYKNWNKKFNYPIYIHTFGKIFEKQEEEFFKKKYKNIFFKIINPEIPKNIKKKELFFYRFYNNYSFKSFNRKRLGYLHACYFASNISTFGNKGCLGKELKKYDYLLRIDDDSWLRKKINYDFFKKFKKYPMGTARLTITKDSRLPLTREELYSFLKKYIKDKNIKVSNKKLKSIFDLNDEKKLDLMPYSEGNFDMYNMKYFKSKRFKNFISRVNKFGGQYKYRWADYDLLNLYLYIYYNNPIYDFNLSEKVYLSAHPEAKRINDDNTNKGLYTSLIEEIHNITFLIYKRLMRFTLVLKMKFQS